MEHLKEILKSRNVWLILLLVMFVVIFIIAITNYNRKKEQEEREVRIRRESQRDKVTEKELELNRYMRKLWADNAYWMRNYIVSYITGSKDMNQSAKRLLKNQEQIGRAMGMWYGKDSGKKIMDLLQKNMVAFGDMLSGMLTRKKNDAIVAEKRWHANTESLTSFLNSLNPKLDKTVMTGHMKKYNELMTKQAITRFRGQHEVEINTFDKAYHHSMYELADTITKAIVGQFPEKFDREPELTDKNMSFEKKDDVKTTENKKSA